MRKILVLLAAFLVFGVFSANASANTNCTPQTPSAPVNDASFNLPGHSWSYAFPTHSIKTPRSNIQMVCNSVTDGHRYELNPVFEYHDSTGWHSGWYFRLDDDNETGIYDPGPPITYVDYYVNPPFCSSSVGTDSRWCWTVVQNVASKTYRMDCEDWNGTPTPWEEKLIATSSCSAESKYYYSACNYDGLQNITHDAVRVGAHVIDLSDGQVQTAYSGGIAKTSSC